MSSSNATSLLRGSAVLIIWGSKTDESPTEERALNDWWTNEHLPERLSIPGFHRTRRYYYASPAKGTGTDDGQAKTESGTSHYLVLYEVSSLATLTSPEYIHALDNPTPMTKKFMPVLTSMNRSACRVLISQSRDEFSKCKTGGVGGTLAHVVFPAPPSPTMREKLKECLAGDMWQLLVRKFPSLLAVHLLEHDDEASQSGSSTKSYEEVKFQNPGGKSDQGTRWMLVAEFSDPFGAPFASYKEKCAELGQALKQNGVDMAKLKEEIYGLVVVMEE